LHGNQLRIELDDLYFSLHLERTLLALGATRDHLGRDLERRAAHLDRRWRDLPPRDRWLRSAQGSRVRRVVGTLLSPPYHALELAVVIVANVVYLPVYVVRRLGGRRR
jgi:hypothetical protein